MNLKLILAKKVIWAICSIKDLDEWLTLWSDRTSADRTVRDLSASHFVQIFRKIVSWVRLLSGFCLSRFFFDFCPDLFVSILFAVGILSGFWKKRLWSVCPARKGRDRAVRTFTVLVRRHPGQIRRSRQKLIISKTDPTIEPLKITVLWARTILM